MLKSNPRESSSQAQSQASEDEFLFKTLFETSKRVKLPKGAQVFSPGDPCKNFIVVVKGSVKVSQISESGREIVLYRVQNEESCLLTTASLLARENYSVSAVTETDVEAILIPSSSFETGLQRSPEMRRFVFNNYSRRMAEFFVLVRELAFETLDVRLCHRLLQHSSEDNQISMTHQDLAAELGSTREVVSRRLKEFEQLGWLKLRRGRIEIINRVALSEGQ